MGPALSRRLRAGAVLSLLIFSAIIFAQLRQHTVEDDDREPQDLQQARGQAMKSRHTDAKGRAMAGARLKALQQFMQMQRQQLATFSAGSTDTAAAALATNAWKPIGPQPILQ